MPTTSRLFLFYIILLLLIFHSAPITKMAQLSRTATDTMWSRSEIDKLQKYRARMRQVEQKENIDKILTKDSNQMSFYNITPKEDLPKALQKMHFQTLNSKEINVGSYVKVFQKDKPLEGAKIARKTLKKQGQIMLLSQIYERLGDNLQSNRQNYTKHTQLVPLSNVINQLDQWEKKIPRKHIKENNRFSKIRRTSFQEQRRSSNHKKEFIIKKFKIGSDYKAEIQKNLDVIDYTHANEQNLVQKYSLIETSSKLLKRELEEMKDIVTKEIDEKMKKLTESRKEHHRLFEEKLKLQMEGQELDEEINRDQIGLLQNLGYSLHTESQNKMKVVMEEKRKEIDINEAKIRKIKKTIQFLEEETIKNEEELKSIMTAEKTYYLTSLKKGIDCRETGLVWVIHKLGLQESDMPSIQFPEYLDKKSRAFLMKKSALEDILSDLLREKREFVSEIGKSSDKRTSQRKSSIKLEKLMLSQGDDFVKQSSQANMGEQDIHKRYQRSARKITALREQYLQNQGMLRLNMKRGSMNFGGNLDGLTGKQIYEEIGQKIKQVDFSKLKKNQMQKGRDKIFEYQLILREIEALHMQLEDQENHHEVHLLNHYKDQKDTFFSIAAACFGVKRAYALIIKNFSWKISH